MSEKKKVTRQGKGYSVTTTDHPSVLSFLSSIAVDSLESYSEIHDISMEQFESKRLENEQFIKDAGDGTIDDYASQTLRGINDRYVQTMRYALYLMIYGDLESELSEKVTMFVGQKHRAALKDMHGNGMKRIEIYLAKVSEIALPIGIIGSSSLGLFQDMRNFVAHRGGSIPADKLNLLQSLLATSSVPKESLILGTHIKFGDKFIDYFVGACKETFLAFEEGARKAGYEF